MSEETHPNFQRTHFSKLPKTRTCNTCGELADIVVHAFRQGGHCEKRSCVDACRECQDWITAVVECAPQDPEKTEKEGKRKK